MYLPEHILRVAKTEAWGFYGSVINYSILLKYKHVAG